MARQQPKVTPGLPGRRPTPAPQPPVTSPPATASTSPPATHATHAEGGEQVGVPMIAVNPVQLILYFSNDEYEGLKRAAEATGQRVEMFVTDAACSAAWSRLEYERRMEEEQSAGSDEE